jgi:cerevisin
MRTVAALSLAAIAQAASFSTETIHGNSAPILSSVDADHIPDSYIIKFKDHVDDSSVNEHQSWIQTIHGNAKQDDEFLELRKRGIVDDVVGKVFGGLKHTLSIGDSFKGYAGHFHPDVIEKVRNHPDVSSTYSS